MNLFCTPLKTGMLLLCLVFSSPITLFAHSDDGERHAASQPLSTAQQEVAAVLQDFASAYAATDIEAIHQLVVDDARFSYFEGASADRDWADYAAHLKAEMPAFSNARYVLTQIAPEVSGDMAFATFGWTLDVMILSDQFPNGKHPVSMSGLGTAVLVKTAAGWRLRHLHTARKRSAE